MQSYTTKSIENGPTWATVPKDIVKPQTKIIKIISVILQLRASLSDHLRASLPLLYDNTAWPQVQEHKYRMVLAPLI